MKMIKWFLAVFISITLLSGELYNFNEVVEGVSSVSESLIFMTVEDDLAAIQFQVIGGKTTNNMVLYLSCDSKIIDWENPNPVMRNSPRIEITDISTGSFLIGKERYNQKISIRIINKFAAVFKTHGLLLKGNKQFVFYGSYVAVLQMVSPNRRQFVIGAPNSTTPNGVVDMIATGSVMQEEHPVFSFKGELLYTIYRDIHVVDWWAIPNFNPLRYVMYAGGFENGKIVWENVGGPPYLGPPYSYPSFIEYKVDVAEGFCKFIALGTLDQYGHPQILKTVNIITGEQVKNPIMVPVE